MRPVPLIVLNVELGTRVLPTPRQNVVLLNIALQVPLPVPPVQKDMHVHPTPRTHPHAAPPAVTPPVAPLVVHRVRRAISVQ